MTLSQATLTLPDVDIDQDGTDETGVFEFAGDLTVTVSQTTNYLVETAGTASQISAAINELYDTDAAGLGDTRRKTFAVDNGAGAHRVEIDATGYTGSPGQWGDSSEPSPSAANATGADADTQMMVLDRYLALSNTDSRRPATLEVGEYSQDGLYDPLDVLVQEPNGVFNTERSVSTVDLSLVCVETLDLGTAVDALTREAF